MPSNYGAGEDFWESLGQQGNQSILKEINPEYLLEGLMLEAPVFLSPDVNSQLIGKVPNAGKDWRQKEKKATEDEMFW